MRAMGTFAVYPGERTIAMTAAIFWMFELMVVVFEWTCVSPQERNLLENFCMKGFLNYGPVLSEREVLLPKAQLQVYTAQPFNPVSPLGLGMNAHPTSLLTEPFSHHMALLLDIRRGRPSPLRTLRTWQEISQHAVRMGWSMRRTRPCSIWPGEHIGMVTRLVPHSRTRERQERRPPSGSSTGTLSVCFASVVEWALSCLSVDFPTK
jgi:hypothetical protein